MILIFSHFSNPNHSCVAIFIYLGKFSFFRMGLFDKVRKAWDDRKLRKECLEELLQTAKQQGIELTTSCISTHIEDPEYTGLDNSARKRLEEIKKQKTPYSIEVYVREIRERWVVNRTGYRVNTVWVSQETPKNSFKIGSAINKDYDIQLQEYDAEITELENKGIIKLPDTDKEIAELREKYAQNHNEWEETPMSAWEKQGRSCPSCHGEGDQVVGGYDFRFTNEPCGFCAGSGEVSVEEVRAFHEPQKEPSSDEIGFIKYVANYKKFEQIAILEADKKKLLRPTKYADVFAMIITGF